jgi:RNA polymerase sigma-70 factor (ECF subfamily)
MSIPIVENDDTALIARAQRGNLDAFNALVLRHQDSAYTLAYRLMGEPHSAADTVQDAFIAAWRKLDTYRGGSFRAWLLRIVTNRCYDVLRGQQRRPTVSIDGGRDDDDPEPLDLPDAGETPEAAALRRELQRAIQQCIGALGEDQRVVLVLSDVEGLSYDDIAEQTRVQLGTVKSRLSRARAAVRDCLQGVRELLPGGYRLKGNV